MYLNKCIKCGREFETKNPKRVICPDCLYPDKSMMINSSSEADEVKNPQDDNAQKEEQAPRFYSAGGDDENQQRYSKPQQNNRYPSNRGNYGQQRPQNNNRFNNNRSGYNQQRPQNNKFSNRGGFNQQRPQNNRFNNNKKRPMGAKKPPKQLLINKEQLAQIEFLYKMMLPLPNPDAHEIIAEKIGLEPRKVFFGINLVRQKMMLPKLPFPKRKLAITPDQLFAIKNLYSLLLPVPPIGCHKMIAAQLKMDEWRVHVGIGLIRSQMGLPRWNEGRTDVPEVLKEKTRISNELKAQKEAEKLAKQKEQEKTNSDGDVTPKQTSEEEKPKAKRGRKPKNND